MPSDKIYQFEGVYAGHPELGPISLMYENFLLRGSSLRNTEWIYGIVIFAGHDTRIMRNSTGAKAKFSRIEKTTNYMIVNIFLFQCVLCAIGAVMGSFWNSVLNGRAWYLPKLPGFEVFEVIKLFGTWILIFTNMVPISLLVTLEVVKFI